MYKLDRTMKAGLKEGLGEEREREWGLRKDQRQREGEER